MRRSLTALALLAVVGCGSPAPATGDPAKKVTWPEYQKMDAEQKDDPYVVDNLDDEARKKLAEFQKQKAKQR